MGKMISAMEFLSKKNDPFEKTLIEDMGIPMTDKPTLQVSVKGMIFNSSIQNTLRYILMEIKNERLRVPFRGIIMVRSIEKRTPQKKILIKPSPTALFGLSGDPSLAGKQMERIVSGLEQCLKNSREGVRSSKNYMNYVDNTSNSPAQHGHMNLVLKGKKVTNLINHHNLHPEVERYALISKLLRQSGQKDFRKKLITHERTEMEEIPTPQSPEKKLRFF